MNPSTVGSLPIPDPIRRCHVANDRSIGPSTEGGPYCLKICISHDVISISSMRVAQLALRHRRRRVRPGLRLHQFAETNGPLPYNYSKGEQSAVEIEEDFSLLIADVASRILKRDVELVVVLPKVLQ